MKLISLDKDYSIKLKSSITPFLNPDCIFIPIENNLIPYKKKANIKKGELIFDKFFSPISGVVIGIKECLLENQKSAKCLVIANDFKETSAIRAAARKNLNNLTKTDLKKDLKDLSSERILVNKEIKHIIISGIDDEPYIANEIFIQKENTKIILEMIDGLLNIFPDSKAHIAIKNTDSENIEAYNNFLGTYPNIQLHLVEDLYLIGREENLTEKLNIKEDYLFLKASDIFTIYNNVKKRSPIYEKYITITGDGIKNPQVFNAKLGVKVIDIINNYFDLNIKDYDIYLNGLMQGVKADISNLIFTKDLEGLIIMKKRKIKEKNCINCGKCLEICPIHSNPLLAYKKGEKVDCINCGLCTYICPSYINLRQYIRGDNHE